MQWSKSCCTIKLSCIHHYNVRENKATSILLQVSSKFALATKKKRMVTSHPSIFSMDVIRGGM